jgi:alkyl hydroperoxide reductase subunit F
MYDTIIIGAGISGMTAAIYAARKKMNFELISSTHGGQFLESGEVLNYPGIPKTTGIEFSQKMQEQMKFNDIKIKTETVKKVKKLKKHFKVITDKNQYESKTIIITSGARARKLDIPGEVKFAQKGVTYCSICDGPLFSNLEVAIIGGGNSAFEAVDFMKYIAKKIYLIIRGDEIKAHEYLQEAVKKVKNLEIIKNAQTTEILGDVMVQGIKYKQAGEEKQLNVGGVIIEIGRIPNTDCFKDLVELDEQNHIKIDCQTRTTMPGVFAAGDCAAGHEYQYVIAAGQGCMALLKAARYINTLKEK